MVACSIGQIPAIKESLEKSTRGFRQWHGHQCAVKRVFECMAMPRNDGHFEERDLCNFRSFCQFVFLEISCAEAVRAND